MSQITITALFLASLGSTALGGFYYAFSNSVMKALGDIPIAQGAAAMQAINIYVPKSLFLAAFFGVAILCVALAALSFARFSNGVASVLILTGCALYLAGSFGVTVALNVPLNSELAAQAPETAEAAEVWTRYLKNWTFWNHVRTIASFIGGGVLFAAALVVSASR